MLTIHHVLHKTWAYRIESNKYPQNLLQEMIVYILLINKISISIGINTFFRLNSIDLTTSNTQLSIFLSHIFLLFLHQCSHPT